MRSVLTLAMFLSALAAYGQTAPAPQSDAPPAAAAPTQDNTVFIPSQGKPASPSTTPAPATPPAAGGTPTIMLPGTAKPGAEPTKPSAPGGNLKTTGSFRSRLDHGNKLLLQGDADSALAQYRDLQTDSPESPLLYYNIGCAEYKRGLQEAELKAARDATASFELAKASFEKARLAPDPALRRDAGFNHANSVAREAEQAAGAQQYEQSVKAFKDAVEAYEAFLKEYPDHAGAKKNLDYVRYRLKSMMQNPPPPQKGDQNSKNDKDGQQQEKKDSDKSDQQNDDRKQQDQKQQDQKQDPSSNPDQSKQDQQDRKQGAEEKKDDKQQQQQQQQEQQANAQQAKPEDQQSQQDKAQDAGKEDRQNVESILQTLEDVDKREQKEMRNQRTELSVRKEWW